MKVSGFTIVRNALKYDYPAKEAILSVLPLVDEMVVAVGQSEDGTMDLIKSISSNKIRIIETVWDDTLREGGKVLAEETNKAFQAVSPDADWCIYIQADEVIPENCHNLILEGMKHWKDDENVEGLLLNYLHFYGSYDFIGDSRKWYRREIRVIKNQPEISSYKDAQGFRINGRKLRVKPLKAFVYHYGWVKPPEKQQEKQKSFNKYWHNDQWMQKNVGDATEFDYSGIDSLKPFLGQHPQVMKERIDRKNWHFNFDPSKKKMGMKNKLLYLIEKISGVRIGEYKNYKII
jgi:hypothetical protein